MTFTDALTYSLLMGLWCLPVWVPLLDLREPRYAAVWMKRRG